MELTIVAINCDLPFFEYLKRELEENLKARITLRSINLPLQAYSEERKQFDAKKLLDTLLLLMMTETGGRTVGITEKDIYFDGMNFIFGMGNLGGRHCIISTARLNPAFYGQKDDEKFKKRLLKEVYHELGHTMGLMHCKEKNCVMSFSNSLDEVDSKGKDYCPNCNEKGKK
ncbi:archaemetzincin family Zn-dependent metalloprotease [Candidatus Micrarchaeota archaeon]|nr:archaemetzincin family Zn-dependent metalloprotease [Candidatus Micrarchaeota archaeon]